MVQRKVARYEFPFWDGCLFAYLGVSAIYPGNVSDIPKSENEHVSENKSVRVFSTQVDAAVC